MSRVPSPPHIGHGALPSGRRRRHSWLARPAALVLTITCGLFVACSKKSASPTQPDPTPPPAPAPTSNTLDILRSDGGATSHSGGHPPYADVGYGYDVKGKSGGGYAGRMYAEAVISLGVGEHPIAMGAVYSDWSNQAGNYLVSADTRWHGHLGGNGILGAGAHVNFLMEIRDFNNRLLASQVLHDREIRESGLTVGGLTDDGTASAALNFTLPANTGGPFRIWFKLTCEATSGLVGVDAACLFGNSPSLESLGGNGYAEWTSLSVTQFF